MAEVVVMRLIPLAEPGTGLPAPKAVQAIEAVQHDGKVFSIVTLTIDGDVTEVGMFPGWDAVLGMFKDHVIKANWKHWQVETEE